MLLSTFFILFCYSVTFLLLYSLAKQKCTEKSLIIPSSDCRWHTLWLEILMDSGAASQDAYHPRFDVPMVCSLWRQSNVCSL